MPPIGAAGRADESRDVGCYLGLQQGRRNSGQSEPQLHISKEGDPYLRTLLVQGAQHFTKDWCLERSTLANLACPIFLFLSFGDIGPQTLHGSLDGG